MISASEEVVGADGPPSRRRSPPSRLLVILALLVITGAAGAALWTQQARMQALADAVRTLQGGLSRAQEEANALQAQLAQQETARRTLIEQLNAAQRKADQAQQMIATVQQQQAASAARYATLQGEKEALVAQLAGAARERDEALRQAASLRTEKDDLESQHRALKQRYASLMRDLRPSAPSGVFREAERASAGREPSGAIELPPIVVHHRAPSPSAPLALPAAGAPARIVEVNERYDFVVVDRGSAEDIDVGMVFDIMRDGRRIGTATARQVREHLAACDVTPINDTPVRFRVGDIAVPRRG